jgi:3-phosphoshikimate 1-carboxyvinyltransferase
MKIKPANRIKGRVVVSGDKSISHRAAIISALARGESRLENFSTSKDCASTVSALEQLGVSVNRQGNTVTIKAGGRLRPPSSVLDCGNSGSTLRMLAGVLAGEDFTSTLSGDESLRSRPMMRIIEPLQQMGAEIQSVDGKPPLKIKGCAHLNPIDYELPVASAQVKTCLLFAGLSAAGQTTVTETELTRDHTERLLAWFDVPLQIEVQSENTRKIAIDGPVNLRSRDVRIPGDVSSAAFLISAAALLPGSELQVADVGLNPTRTQFLSVLQTLGMDIRIADVRDECNEPVGDIVIKGRERFAEQKADLSNTVPKELIPRLIDELPLLAIVGSQLQGGVIIRGSSELRFKESDRIAATVSNLRAMGADVEEFEDGLAVSGPQRLKGAELDSYGDHRIAMAFAVAALLADGESSLNGIECVAISFPEFFKLLESIVQN